MPNQRTENRSAGEGAKKKKKKKKKKHHDNRDFSLQRAKGQRVPGGLGRCEQVEAQIVQGMRDGIVSMSRASHLFFFLVFAFGAVQTERWTRLLSEVQEPKPTVKQGYHRKGTKQNKTGIIKKSRIKHILRKGRGGKKKKK